MIIKTKWRNLISNLSFCLKMNTESDLYKETLRRQHYGAMLNMLNKKDTADIDREKIKHLLVLAWGIYEKYLVVHDTGVYGGRNESELRNANQNTNLNRSFQTNIERARDNNDKVGIYTDLVYDTYPKKWGMNYQFTFHEFFHNIDHLANKEDLNSISDDILKSYSAEYLRFGEIIFEEAKELSEAQKDKILGLPNRDKAFLCDIIGGALYYDSYRYGCKKCINKEDCDINNTIDLCPNKHEYSWGHEPNYWMLYGTFLYLMPDGDRNALIREANENTGKVIEILQKRLRNKQFIFEEKDKVVATFRKLAAIANISEAYFNELYKEDIESLYEIAESDRLGRDRKCLPACANIAAKAAATESQEAELVEIRKYFPYRLAYETFANIASAAVSNPNAFKEIKSLFPKTCDKFTEILEMIVFGLNKSRIDA